MKILVVDDEQAVGARLGHTLRKLGHEAPLAAHPGDALAMLDSDIDAVITDIHMPDMNGVELARAIRDLDGEMPIAFCTGSDPSDDIVTEAAAIGRVLPKVFTVGDVVKDLARRTAPRNLSVRFALAEELADDYERMRQGVLRIAGGHNFLAGERVQVEVELPGFVGTFSLVAQVVTTDDHGCNLRITSSPAGFSEALDQSLDA
jgi:CheY-like chemotaxis protein